MLSLNEGNSLDLLFLSRQMKSVFDVEELCGTEVCLAQKRHRGLYLQSLVLSWKENKMASGFLVVTFELKNEDIIRTRIIPVLLCCSLPTEWLKSMNHSFYMFGAQEVWY